MGVALVPAPSPSGPMAPGPYGRAVPALYFDTTNGNALVGGSVVLREVVTWHSRGWFVTCGYRFHTKKVTSPGPWPLNHSAESNMIAAPRATG